MSTDYRKFVEHPRYGQGPQITGLNPEIDHAAGRVFLHWHSPREVRVPGTAIAADLSRQARATIAVTHYFDAKRRCADCGRPFLFFAAEQKYWYEDLGFPLDSDCVRCVPCRKKQQGLELHRQRYEELFHIRERTSEQNRDLAVSALSLIEGGVFGLRSLERVRAALKMAGCRDDLEDLWERMLALENVG